MVGALGWLLHVQPFEEQPTAGHWACCLPLAVSISRSRPALLLLHSRVGARSWRRCCLRAGLADELQQLRVDVQLADGRPQRGPLLLVQRCDECEEDEAAAVAGAGRAQQRWGGLQRGQQRGGERGTQEGRRRRGARQWRVRLLLAVLVHSGQEEALEGVVGGAVLQQRRKGGQGDRGATRGSLFGFIALALLPACLLCAYVRLGGVVLLAELCCAVCEAVDRDAYSVLDGRPLACECARPERFSRPLQNLLSGVEDVDQHGGSLGRAEMGVQRLRSCRAGRCVELLLVSVSGSGSHHGRRQSGRMQQRVLVQGEDGEEGEKHEGQVLVVANPTILLTTNHHHATTSSRRRLGRGRLQHKEEGAAEQRGRAARVSAPLLQAVVSMEWEGEKSLSTPLC